MGKVIDPQLQRLLDALKAAGVETGVRNKTVSDRTGYAENTILKVLSGNSPSLSARFVRSVCEAFGIRQEWIEKGVLPKLKEEEIHAYDVNSANNLLMRSGLLMEALLSDSDSMDTEAIKGFLLVARFIDLEPDNSKRFDRRLLAETKVLAKKALGKDYSSLKKPAPI